MATTTRDDVLTRLDEGIAALTSSERWTAWLRVQARFHRYSFSNTLLIELQHPGSTRVCGYRAWQALGRQVRKGERGIAILAPVVRRGRLADAGEATGAQDDAPTAVRRVATFIVAWVWDPLP
jgi:DNA primase